MASVYPELDYIPGSFVGPLDMSIVQGWEASLLKQGEDKIVPLDASYLDYIAQYHGGRLKDGYFRTHDGTEHVLLSFYHFDRSLPRANPRCCETVSRVWSDTYDRLGFYLHPFAELAFGDMACFDYRHPGRPAVVVWFHEESEPHEEPKTEFVAENFDEFLQLLAKHQQERHPLGDSA